MIVRKTINCFRAEPFKVPPLFYISRLRRTGKQVKGGNWPHISHLMFLLYLLHILICNVRFSAHSFLLSDSECKIINFDTLYMKIQIQKRGDNFCPIIRKRMIYRK